MSNPYGPPTNTSDLNRNEEARNPAKLLLFLVGALALVQGAAALLVGLFVGPHVLSVAAAMLAFGAAAIWLGRRRYDGFGRHATIAWGLLAIFAIAVASAVHPPSTQDFIGIIFFTLLLTMIGAISAIAVWRQPARFTS